MEQDGDTQIRINFQKALQAAKTEELAAAGITADPATGLMIGMGMGMGMGGDPHSGLTCDTSMGAGDASSGSGSAMGTPNRMHVGMSAGAGVGAGVLGYGGGFFQGLSAEDLSLMHGVPGMRMPPVQVTYSDQTESPRFGSPTKHRNNTNRPRSPHAISKPPTVEDIKGMEDAANIIKLLGTNA